MSFTIGVPTAAQALPTGTATIEIFNSVTAFGAYGLRHLPIKRISFGVEHDQGFTVVASASSNGGTNWDVVNSQAVAVAANTIGGPFDYLVDTYDDFKISITNGGVDQTVWRPTLKGNEDTRAIGT
jgi:hypothetical protein